ncbi:MAG: hypothetical protein V8S10_01445 [Clostridia bacterium]
MEYVVLLIIAIIIFIILGIMFDVNIKKIKQIGEDKELDILTQKYPKNIEICKWYLRKLKNENVKIEEDEKSNATLYLVTSNKIFIANLKNSYTRIQTIAHECLHSIQNKKLLWFNFIFSNIYLLYFAIIFLLGIFKVLHYKMLFMAIFLILSLVYYAVRTYLENDAMIKARFLAKEYMEDVKISTKEEIDKIIARYDELNDIGIKFTNFQFLSKILLKVFILVLIFIIF